MDNNTVLEIRQRAAELMREAMLIWQSGVHSENLEGLDEDPVFQMLMTAMAYQFNEIDSNLETIKQQVMDDFAEVLMPYSAGNAIPSSVVMKCQPSEGVAAVQIDESTLFSGRSSKISFIPLLRTHVLNVSVDKVVRLDGRRWKVTLLFPESVSSLAGFTFAINDLIFRDIEVSVNGKPLSLIKPWNQHDLPLTEPFDFSNRLYNNTPIFNAVTLCMDILARQDVCLLCVGEEASEMTFPDETRSLDLVFEFFGIDNDFVLDKTKLHLNANILVNAMVNTVSLSETKPIARISDADDQKFLKLLSPPKDQIFNRYSIAVRRVMTERFNLGSLIRLLDCLISKYHSDFYAFQHLNQMEGDADMNSLLSLMQRLRDQAVAEPTAANNGIYLILKSDDMAKSRLPGSFDVRYLTTNGMLDESMLSGDVVISTPLGIDISQCRIIAKPVMGSDAVPGMDNRNDLVSYYVSTSDRIVTPADIRLFCTSTLMEMLSIERNMFRTVAITRDLSPDSPVGYAINVSVLLVNSTLMRKTIGDRIPRLECLVENLLRARSINIYPINVTIKLA